MSEDVMCVCFHPASEHNPDCIHGCNCEVIADEAKKDGGFGLLVDMWLRDNVEFREDGAFRLRSKEA